MNLSKIIKLYKKMWITYLIKFLLEQLADID